MPSNPVSAAPIGQTVTAIQATSYIREAMPVIMEAKERFQAIMGAYDSIYAASMRFAQYNPDQLISQKGYDIFDTMLTLAACRAPFNVKRNSILADGWRVISAIRDPQDPQFEKAAELAAFAHYTLTHIQTQEDLPQDFRMVLFELLRACWDGFHCTEMIWRTFKDGPYKGKIGFEYFASKPAKEIGFDVDLRTLAPVNIRPYTPLEGYQPPIPVEKVIFYTYNPKHGLPYGDGDARASYKHYWILDSVLKFWAMAAERFGSPFLVVKYPIGDLIALAAAQVAIDNIRQGSAALLPDNCEYEVVTLDANTLNNFKTIANWHKEEIVQNLLGNTLTTGEGMRVGSMALGEVHENTQQYGIDLVKADLEQVVYGQIMRRLIRYNYGESAVDLAPSITLTSDKKDPQGMFFLAQSLQILMELGNMNPLSKQVRDILGLPPIDPGDKKLPAPVQLPTATDTNTH